MTAHHVFHSQLAQTYVPYEQRLSTPHNYLNTHLTRAKGSVPRVPLTGGANSPCLEPSANVQDFPTNINLNLQTVPHPPKP